VVYGLEAIQGWSRLAGVIPADFKAQIDDAKSETDFWVNIWFLSLLLFGIYPGLCIDRGHLLHRWVSILALIVALCAPAFANSMAREWGELIKSAFDLFRGELAESLGLELPRFIEHEGRCGRRSARRRSIDRATLPTCWGPVGPNER
jgi:hypothetical protein